MLASTRGKRGIRTISSRTLGGENAPASSDEGLHRLGGRPGGCRADEVRRRDRDVDDGSRIAPFVVRVAVFEGFLVVKVRETVGRAELREGRGGARVVDKVLHGRFCPSNHVSNDASESQDLSLLTCSLRATLHPLILLRSLQRIAAPPSQPLVVMLPTALPLINPPPPLYAHGNDDEPTRRLSPKALRATRVELRPAVRLGRGGEAVGGEAVGA